MRRLLLGLALTYAVFFVFGFIMAETIKITTRMERTTAFHVMVTLPRVTPEHRWVELYACGAEITDEGDVRCAGHWDRRSLQETSDRRQYDFALGRYVPRGTLQISAVAMDANWKVLASGQTRVIR